MILDENGNEIFEEDLDLESGYLVPDQIFVKHHDAQPEIEEESHIEVIAEYPNGGRDVKTVIDTPYQSAKEAWDEYEDIQRYVIYTEEELSEIEKNKQLSLINELKQKLSETDYCIIKIAEGVADRDEYADIISQRSEWRDEINRIEDLINEGSD